MSTNYDTDSEEELPHGWEERVTLDGKVYYAKLVWYRKYINLLSWWSYLNAQ